MSTTKVVPVAELNGKQVYVTPTGLRHGSKGKVTPPEAFFKPLTKGEARRLRKGLWRAGFRRLSRTGLPGPQRIAKAA